LITDFGRTSNLTASMNLKAKSQQENVAAVRLQILLEVDNAYFAALRAQSLARVARVTLKERQLVARQVTALEQNQLRSPLDLTFARVNQQQAALLLSHAENDLQSAFATLAALLDEPEVTAYRLSDDLEFGRPDGDVSRLIANAYRDRPDLARLRLELESARRFTKAEGALSYPNVSAQATGGKIPYHDATTNKDYGAAGIIVNMPLLSGGLYTARRKEAELKAKAAEETLHDATNSIARDVRIAWLGANNAFKNLEITHELREQAKKSLSLAQARYDVGTSSMIELSQAQVNATAAEIDDTSARYEYLLRRAILEFQTGALK
jgi:outer membrane protein